MIRFILNNRDISTSSHPGTTLLDFIRYEKHLTGTKIGCREGDCGACSILIGDFRNGKLQYTSATSCLMALGNAAGKHIVTIEGINGEGLTPVQSAFAAEGATQCGFCTPGFIMSLTGYAINEQTAGNGNAIDAMNGNICRCTGYKSIQRAAGRVENLMQTRKDEQPLTFAVRNQLIPGYFLGIEDRLKALQDTNGPLLVQSKGKFLGGGTDLYVQQHDAMTDSEIRFLFNREPLNGIEQAGTEVVIGGAATVTDIAESPIFRSHFPQLDRYIKLVSSVPIRNMATIAGNFTNASPIGDFSIFFLALDAVLVLDLNGRKRECKLRDFYKGYKQLMKDPEEVIEKIRCTLPSEQDHFHFEKVCKRTHLDIASVNTALYLKMDADVIADAGLSAGGVAPVPAYLPASSQFLKGKVPGPELLEELIRLANSEISPISDARGTVEYKRLLLSQLIRAHFTEMFPEIFNDLNVSA